MIKCYSLPNCPMCEMLKEKLKENNVSFEEIQDKEILKSKGITHVPCLEMEDNTILKLADALKWVNENGFC